MSDIKTKYGSSAQLLTCTLASLANNAARQATEVDNTSNLFLDALVQLTIKTGASGVTATGYINIYVAGTVDAGTTYPDGVGASDAAAAVPLQMRPVAVMPAVAVATTYKSNPISIASAFGGAVPAKWVIIIENKTGGALSSTEGDHVKQYQGVLEQAV